MSEQPLPPRRAIESETRPAGSVAVRRLLPILLLAATAVPAWGLSTDKDEPIEVEADSAELDDARNVSVYRGNIVVVQGSMRMTGDVMTVHHTDDNKLDRLIIEGRPATYRQMPDDGKAFDEAEARRMEYHESKELILLIDRATVRQDRVLFSGDRIEYDTRLSKVRAWSKPGARTAGDETAEQQPGERVRIIIKARDDD
jgi:lipopolysaccharide export system protein LptA